MSGLTVSPDDHRALEPPDPIPNSAVKRCFADGSVGSPHVRVGHRQAPILKPRPEKSGRGFYFGLFYQNRFALWVFCLGQFGLG